MATFRESETETIALIEWHRSCGRTVTRRTEQAMTEADACAAALTFALAGIWTDYRWQALSTALVLGFAAAATSKPKTPKPEALYRSEDKS